MYETQETNKSIKTHKANVNINRVKRKRVVCSEIKSNEIDVVIEEDHDNEESQHSGDCSKLFSAINSFYF